MGLQQCRGGSCIMFNGDGGCIGMVHVSCIMFDGDGGVGVVHVSCF